MEWVQDNDILAAARMPAAEGEEGTLEDDWDKLLSHPK